MKAAEKRLKPLDLQRLLKIVFQRRRGRSSISVSNAFRSVTRSIPRNVVGMVAPSMNWQKNPHLVLDLEARSSVAYDVNGLLGLKKV